LAGLSATKEEYSLKCGMPGWRRSADRAGLHAISLLSGNLTGNFAIFGHLEMVMEQKTAALQPLIEQFPMPINRDFISRNRDFSAWNRESYLQNRKRPSLAHFSCGP
jgi:hypothetical protein